MLDMDQLALDAYCLRCSGCGAKSFVSPLLHARLVQSWRVFEHLRVGREHMKRRHDRQRGDFDANLFGQCDAMLNGLTSELRTVRRY